MKEQLIEININQRQQRRLQYLDYLIDPRSFQGVYRVFISTFDTNANRLVHSRYYLPSIKIEGYNVMIDGNKFVNWSRRLLHNWLFGIS